MIFEVAHRMTADCLFDGDMFKLNDWSLEVVHITFTGSTVTVTTREFGDAVKLTMQADKPVWLVGFHSVKGGDPISR